MDESRPGHPTRLPLIIERPDLAHPVRRTVGLVLTLLAWGVWFGLWFVLLATIGRSLGFDFPLILLPTAVSRESLRILIYLLPYAIATAVAVLALAYALERLKRRWARPDERWRPVGLERLAHDAALDPANIARWQQAQILYVEHGPGGHVSNASTVPPGPGQAA
jgi:poly-beta-1,6-N-acetyl-D-glucosamine biosynthesis protein PgaD